MSNRYCDLCGHRPARRGVHPLALSMMPELDRRLRVCVPCDHRLEDEARQLLRAS